MTTPTCDRCSATMPADTAYVCNHCAATVRAALEQAAGLAADLDTTITRQAVTGAGTGRGETEARLPFDPGAALARDTVAQTVTTWARHIITTRGGNAPAPRPPIRTLRLNRCTSIARGKECKHRRGVHNPRIAQVPDVADDTALAATLRYLVGQVEWLRHQPIAGTALDELHYAADVLRRALDRRADRVYLGQCAQVAATGECGTDLYANPDRATVTCRNCEATWDVGELRRWLLRALEDVLAPITVVARGLSALGADARYGSISGWASKGELVVHPPIPGTTANRVRVGDVLDLLARTVRRKTSKSLVSASTSALVDSGPSCCSMKMREGPVCPLPKASGPVRRGPGRLRYMAPQSMCSLIAATICFDFAASTSNRLPTFTKTVASSFVDRSEHVFSTSYRTGLSRRSLCRGSIFASAARNSAHPAGN